MSSENEHYMGPNGVARIFEWRRWSAPSTSTARGLSPEQTQVANWRFYVYGNYEKGPAAGLVISEHTNSKPEAHRMFAWAKTLCGENSD